MTVYRIKDPILGDVPEQFDEGVLDSPVATPEVVLAADCILVGAPGRQGRMCAEVGPRPHHTLRPTSSNALRTFVY